MRMHANVGIRDSMNALVYVNYISDYDDRRAGLPQTMQGGTIDDQTTIDLHFTANFMDDALSVTVSGINVTDEEPPVAYSDLMYDGYTHNALGRMFKVGVRYGF